MGPPQSKRVNDKSCPWLGMDASGSDLRVDQFVTARVGRVAKALSRSTSASRSHPMVCAPSSASSTSAFASITALIAPADAPAITSTTTRKWSLRLISFRISK